MANDLSTDQTAISQWRFGEGANRGADELGLHQWSEYRGVYMSTYAGGPEPGGTIYLTQRKVGAYNCAIYITDANLDSRVAFKSGSSPAAFCFCGWYKPDNDTYRKGYPKLGKYASFKYCTQVNGGASDLKLYSQINFSGGPEYFGLQTVGVIGRWYFAVFGFNRSTQQYVWGLWDSVDQEWKDWMEGTSSNQMDLTGYVLCGGYSNNAGAPDNAECSICSHDETMLFDTLKTQSECDQMIAGTYTGSIPRVILDTMPAPTDSITGQLIRARSVTVLDSMPTPTDSLTAEMATHLEVTILDTMPAPTDSFDKAFLHGFVGNLADVMPTIQDAITVGKINLELPARWLAPLKITPVDTAIIPAQYWAAHPVRHPDFYFKPVIKNYGIFTRSIGAPPDLVRLSDVTITVLDADNTIRQALSPKTIQKALAELRLGPELGSYAGFLRPYRREIGHLSQTRDGELAVTLRDRAFNFLERPIPNVINTDNFPNLAENASGMFANIVAGTVSSPDGALPCPCVDPDQHWYLACRNVGTVHDVFKLNSDTNEWESVGGWSQKTDYYIEHELGSGDYCTLIVFSADQEGAQIRANVSGPDAATLSNFADAINALLLYHAWAGDYTDLIHQASVAETRTRVADLTCAGAFTKAITFREALTQLQRSSNIDVFPDKDDRIRLKYTLDDEEPTINLSDLMRLHKGSVQQDIASPAYNKIPYRYKPNYAANTWEEDTYDNTADQEALGEVAEAEAVQLYFVRDATTAQTVIERRAQYMDLDSFRFKGKIPIVPVLETIEIADIITIDHFGGMRAGGYVDEQFKLLELGMDINNLAYTFRGIRRRLGPQALVETYPDGTGSGEVRGGTRDDDGTAILVQQGITAKVAINARPGPHSRGVDGELFAIFRKSTDATKLEAWYTENYGVTWLRRDEANAPNLTNTIYSYDCYASGNLIYIATQESTTGRVGYHIFNMASQTWTTVNQQVVASTASGTNAWCVSIEGRYPGGEPVIFFQGDQVLAGTQYWHHGYFTILQSGSWTTPVRVTQTAGSYAGHASSHANIQRVVAGRENRMHFLYCLDPADRWVSWSPDDWVRTMTAGLGLGGPQLLNMSSIHYPAPRNCTGAALFSDREKILVLRKVGYGRSWRQILNEGEPVTKASSGYLTGQIMGEGGGGGTHNPAGFVGVDPSNDDLYVAACGWSNLAYNTLQKSEDGGTTWAAAQKIGASHPSRYTAEHLHGNMMRVKGKMYVAYFTQHKTKGYPTWRWLKAEDLPYTE